MRFASTAVLWLTVWALAACQTIEYGPVDGRPPARFGYAEKADSSGRYVLTLVGPAGAIMDVMQSYWDRRAAELCGGPVFTKTMYRAERPTVLYGYGGGMAGAPMLEGFLDCKAAPASAPASP